MTEIDIREAVVEALEAEYDFSNALAQVLIQTNSMQEKALQLIEKHYDITTLSKEELYHISHQTIELLYKQTAKNLSTPETVAQVFNTESEVYKFAKLVNKDFIEDIDNPSEALLKYTISQKEAASRTLALLTALEMKKLKEQHQHSKPESDLVNLEASLSKQIQDLSNSLNINNKKKITVKMFEDIYSIGEETQRKLRARYKDPLPYEQTAVKGTVLYDVVTVDKWFENYRKN